jgi:hypothetical protein
VKLWERFHGPEITEELITSRPAFRKEKSPEGAAVEVDPVLFKEIAQLIFSVCSLDEESEKALRLERGIKEPERWGIKSIKGDLLYHLMKAGASVEDLVKSGLYQYESESLAAHPVLRAGRLLLPFYDKSISNITGFTSRRKFSDNASTSLKYILPRAMKATHWVWSDFKAGEKQPWCIVTEGILKAISARQESIPCLGKAGIQSAPLALRKELKRIEAKTVFIIYDTDISKAGKLLYADRAALKLQQEVLYDFDVYFKKLPALLNQDGSLSKMDLDTYLLTHSKESLLALLGINSK